MARLPKRMKNWAVTFCSSATDLDEAIRWAEKIPAVEYGSVEIHPLWGQR